MDSLRPFLNLAPRRKASIGLTLLLLTGLVLSACGAHKSEVNKTIPVVPPLAIRHSLLCLSDPIPAGVNEKWLRNRYNIHPAEPAATVHNRLINPVTSGVSPVHSSRIVWHEREYPQCNYGEQTYPELLAGEIIAQLEAAGMPNIGIEANRGMVDGIVEDILDKTDFN